MAVAANAWKMMLPVPGSRYAYTGDSIAISVITTNNNNLFIIALSISSIDSYILHYCEGVDINAYGAWIIPQPDFLGRNGVLRDKLNQ